MREGAQTMSASRQLCRKSRSALRGVAVFAKTASVFVARAFQARDLGGPERAALRSLFVSESVGETDADEVVVKLDISFVRKAANSSPDRLALSSVSNVLRSDCVNVCTKLPDVYGALVLQMVLPSTLRLDLEKFRRLPLLAPLAPRLFVAAALVRVVRVARRVRFLAGDDESFEREAVVREALSQQALVGFHPTAHGSR